MARPSTKDPLDKFRWAVNIEGFTRFGFTSCDVPSLNINFKNYAEGGAHLFPRKIVESVEYNTVTFNRGVTTDKSFHSWISSIFQNLTPNAELKEYRRQVIIHHLNRQGKIVKAYVLYNAFPVEYKPASDFSADADDALSIEKLSLIYEGFSVFVNDKGITGTDASDIFKRLINRI